MTCSGPTGAKILLKRSETSGVTPDYLSLCPGEIAINMADGIIFTRGTTGTDIFQWSNDNLQQTQTNEIRVTIDNSGSVITGGTASTYIEKGCTLKAASIYADQAGEVTASLSRVRGTTTDYMGSVTLNGVTGVRDFELIGWTSDLAIGDVLHVNWGGTLDAVTRATLTLRGEY